MIEFDDDGFVVMENVPDTDVPDDDLVFDDPPPLPDATWLRIVSAAVESEQDPMPVEDLDAAPALDLPPATDTDALDWSDPADDTSDDPGWPAVPADTDDDSDDPA